MILKNHFMNHIYHESVYYYCKNSKSTSQCHEHWYHMNMIICFHWIWWMKESSHKRKMFWLQSKKTSAQKLSHKLFSKLQSTTSINSKKNQSDTQNKKTYAASIISIAISQNQSRIQASSFYKSENNSFWNQVIF